MSNNLTGIKVKLNNRRIRLVEVNNGTEYIIELKNLKHNPDEKPSCNFECIDKKLNITTIKLSEEGLEALLYAYMKYKEEKSHRISQQE